MRELSWGYLTAQEHVLGAPQPDQPQAAAHWAAPLSCSVVGPSIPLDLIISLPSCSQSPDKCTVTIKGQSGSLSPAALSLARCRADGSIITSQILPYVFPVFLLSLKMLPHVGVAQR